MTNRVIIELESNDNPVERLLFHHESIKMKPHGILILKNFLEL